MRLSTKGRYAVTAMLDLAAHADRGPITLATISHDQGISLSYLEQLFARLRRDGLVEGVRGPGGGYRLAKAPEAISVADIIAAVDDKAEAAPSPPKPESADGEPDVQELWSRLSGQIFDYLASINLAEFLARPAARAVLERPHRAETR